MNEKRWLYAWGLGSISVGAASLLIPLYVVQLGGNPFELGLLGAVSAFIGAPGAIVWGRLADRTSNPRRIIQSTLLGVGVLLGLIPQITSIPLLILLNALVWLVFAAAGPIVTLLVVADVPEREWNREIALLNKHQGYGWASGLLLGIVWSATGGRLLSPAAAQRSLFLVCGGIAIASAVLLVRWMPETSDRQLPPAGSKRVARILSTGRRGVRGATFLFNPTRLYWSTRNISPRRLADRFSPTLTAYYLGVVFFFTGFSAFFAPLPLYLTGVGFTSDTVFGLYLVSSLGSAAFYSGAGELSSRIDLRLLQTSALGLRGIAMPLVAITGAAFASGTVNTVISGVLFTVIGASWAVITVTAGTIVTRLAPPGLRGEALGIYAALSALAGGIGSLGGGALADRFGFTVTFGVAGAVILAGAVLIILLHGISSQTKLTLGGSADATDVSGISSED